jgi:hypothetical protein
VVRVAIPGGLWSDSTQFTDVPRRQLELRPVSGEDELFLLDTAKLAEPSERATALLSRCLGDSDVETTALALTVGDREALLLHLRRLTLGETLDCVLSCPAEGCGERIELELHIAELLVPQYADVRREYERVIDADGKQYQVLFRLPTAADMDHVATISRSDPEQGANALLDRCVTRAVRDGTDAKNETLLPSVRSAISAAMSEHDPQAEIELDLTCPSCGTAFSVVFDTAMFLLQELDQRGSQLMQDVHTLAWHYHWSERDILGMSRRRRSRYLGLVGDAVARGRTR